MDANNRINKLHEPPSDLHMMIMKPHSRTYSHHTNIQTLLLEMYKIKHNLSESCLKDLLSTVNGNYYLPSQFDIGVPVANSIRYFGSVIWNSLPNNLKNICDFDLFKTAIQRWKPVTVLIGCVKSLLVFFICFVKIKFHL